MNQNQIDTIRTLITKNEFVNEESPHGHRLPEEYIKKMQALGEKYREVRWLPLDIPRIELENVDEFKHIWQTESAKILRVQPDVAEPWSKEKHPQGQLSSWNTPTFNGMTLWHHPELNVDAGSFSAKKYMGSNSQFTRLVEQVFDFFPMHTVFSIFIWQSVREVSPHRDKSSYWKCPTDFRAMLHDENDKPTLYVSDIEHGDTHYIAPPADTNSFCWSNGTQVHGSDYHNRNKYLLCISGIQHSTKSDELFERSIKKYKDKLNYDLKINL
jgi:hypothetical protein